MVTKSITLVDYVDALTERLEKNDINDSTKSPDEQGRVLKIEAEMFLKIFKREIAEELNNAFDSPLEEKGREEYFKVLVMFFRRIGSGNTAKFLGYLSLAIQKEEKDEG